MTAIYLPIIRGPYTKSDPSPYTTELSLAGMTREFIVADIRSGQIENVDRILEINEADGTCRDATTDIANDVCAASWNAGEAPFADLRNWLEYHSTRCDYWTEDNHERRALPYMNSFGRWL
jgi:hypothetical protein